jgi:FkbM family methyltransferase
MWAADRHNARVVAVEPDPVANDYLNLHVAINGFDKIAVVDGALANHTGTTHLAPHEFGWGSTMSRLSDDGREIACWSIADLFTKHEIDDCTLVKIDIEGGESIILETVGPFLAERGIPMIVAMHEPWWHRRLEPDWLSGFNLDAPLVGWHSVLCTPR